MNNPYKKWPDILKSNVKLILPEPPHQSLGDCPDLSRRRFLIRSSILASAASLLTLPHSVQAAFDELSWTLDKNMLAILQQNIGFNGERQDSATGLYHLGNGYRAYNPGLMAFQAADTLSPFGKGGINPYAYCLGDPINRVDPNGHLSWQAGLGIVLGILGILTSVFTAGASIAAAGSVMGAIETASATGLALGAVGLASDAVGIVSGALEDTNPSLSGTLGWVSLGLGIAGVAMAGAVSRLNLGKPLSTANTIRWKSMDALPNQHGAVQGPMNIIDKDINRYVFNKKVKTVYRRDRRTPNEIVEAQGFHPRELTFLGVKRHTREPGWKTEGGVSTSSVNLPIFGRYEYKIRLRPRQAINVNETLGPDSLYPWEHEMLIPGHISLEQIIGWRKTI